MDSLVQTITIEILLTELNVGHNVGTIIFILQEFLN